MIDERFWQAATIALAANLLVVIFIVVTWGV